MQIFIFLSQYVYDFPKVRSGCRSLLEKTSTVNCLEQNKFTQDRQYEFRYRRSIADLLSSQNRGIGHLK